MALDKLAINLFKAVQCITKIQCTKCNMTWTSDMIDAYDAVDILIDEGWYATERNIWCTVCNKARLKRLRKLK